MLKASLTPDFVKQPKAKAMTLNYNDETIAETAIRLAKLQAKG